jgi:hypothetical protein
MTEELGLSALELTNTHGHDCHDPVPQEVHGRALRNPARAIRPRSQVDIIRTNLKG